MGTFGDGQPLSSTVSVLPASRKPFYSNLWVQVLLAIALAIALGYLYPAKAIAMKPLGDAFIRLISMIISLVIFCTVVTGIAGMENMKKVGRVGGKALIYFEVVSTLALLIGLVVGNVVRPGAGFNVNPGSLDAKAVTDYAGQAKAQSVTDFLMHIVPATVTDAFAKGDILQVLLVALLFGFALSKVGPRCKPLIDLFDALTHAVFGVVNILMRLAPIGAFGAMAFTVGKYGLASLGPLAKLIGTFYVTCFFFVFALHQGRNPVGIGNQFVRAGVAITDGEVGETGLLQGPCGACRPDGLHLQHRGFKPIYDVGCPLCCSGH